MESFRQVYKCPISKVIIENPVVDCEGNTYEFSHILKWFQNKDTSPVSLNRLQSKVLVPNLTLHKLVNMI